MRKGGRAVRKEAELWAKDALYDFECAKDMLRNKKYNYAVFFARQSVEKMLKACYVQILAKPFPKEHNLLTLATAVFGRGGREISDEIVFLNPHYTITRYVDSALDIPAKLYTESFAKEGIKKAEKVIAWLKNKIK
ncbi:MAG: HEPN domain-containing protein [Candidatus Thermoplasmatota archaeon]